MVEGGFLIAEYDRLILGVGLAALVTATIQKTLHEFHLTSSLRLVLLQETLGTHFLGAMPCAAGIFGP
jgi:hypothetical protein